MINYEIHYKVCEGVFGKEHTGKLEMEATSLDMAVKKVKSLVLNTLDGVFENLEFFFVGGFTK